MNKKELFYRFIKSLERNRLLTKFISNIFDYNELHDYNYLFRVTNNDSEVIIDIYDNISINRFNRYIFSFIKGRYNNRVVNNDGVFIHYIDVLNIDDNKDKLYKLAYLFNLDKNMIGYAETFLDKEIIDILKKINL